MKTLEKPRNQTTAILKQLINSGGVSERQFSFNGFRTRLSELRNNHGLEIKIRIIEFTNQFGRDSHYNEHYLTDFEKEKAVKLYEKLNRY